MFFVIGKVKETSWDISQGTVRILENISWIYFWFDLISI